MARALRHRYRWLTVVVPAAAAVLLAGCTGSPQPATEPSSSARSVSAPGTQPDSAASTSLPATADAAALTTYRGFWAATVDASHTSNWQSAGLPRYARDPALRKIIQALHADAQRGVVARGRPTLRPSIATLEPAGGPTRAQVLDCGDDSGWVKVTADGTPVDARPGGPRQITALLQRDGGGWKVTDFAIQEVGTCA